MILECSKCEALVNAEMVASYEENVEEFPISYRFFKCPKCGRPFLVEEHPFFEPECLYPRPDRRVNPSLPVPIKVAFEEATACFKSKAYTATAIMCRKTLEGICKEHGAAGGNLFSSLKDLRDKGVIEHRLYEWANELRISGNEAAHDVNVTVASDDAKDIIEFTNALLEYVFTFRDRFEAFKKRRAGKGLNLNEGLAVDSTT